MTTDADTRAGDALAILRGEAPLDHRSTPEDLLTAVEVS